MIGRIDNGGAALDQEDMQALVGRAGHERLRRPAAAWLQAYRLARWLDFRESTALCQAGHAWDRAVQEQAVETAIVLVEAN